MGEDALPNETIRLVVTSEEVVTGPYVTLSHCWGGATFLQLTRSNLSRLKSGIEMKELPWTFREAVEVTRRMGVRYLWIDSLCIAQDKDDQSDWLREALLMEKVYTHAVCNIAATASRNSSEGLYRDRDPLPLHRIECEASFSAVTGQSATRSYTVIKANYWETDLHQAPLHTRAWVLQERLLARRVLHFNQKELLWECREQAASETYP